MKARIIGVVMVLAVLILSSVICISESEAGSGYSDIRVYIENEDGEYDLSVVSSVSTIKQAIEKAATAQGKTIEYNSKGNVSSVDGRTLDDDHYWRVHQWLPLGTSGWGVQSLSDSKSNNFMNSGAAYCLHISTMSEDDGTIVYSAPDFRPESKGYVFIRFANGYDTGNAEVQATFTADVREKGFWLEGYGSSMGEVLRDAVESNGLQIDLTSSTDGNGNNLQCWISSMFGLGDENLGGDVWCYWSQWTWVNGEWKYNDWTLGYYDPAVYQYIECIYLISTPDPYSSSFTIDKGGKDPNPDREKPVCIKMDNEVKFVSEGETVYTQYVRYGDHVDLTQVPEPEAPEGKTFLGWGDGITKPITADTTFTAEFKKLVQYTVRYYSEGKKVLLYTEKVNAGESAKYDGVPTKAETDDYYYTFTGWSKDLSAVNSNMDVTPVFEKHEKSPKIPVESITLSSSSETMEVGSYVFLYATVEPSDATDQNITWSTSSSKIATVDQDGKVTAKSIGTAKITAKSSDGKVSAKCDITVTGKPVTGVKISETSLDLLIGKTAVLTATVSPSDASNTNVTWSSSDASVAKVDQTGKVTAVKEGTAKVIVTTKDGNYTAECSVTVSSDKVPVTGISLSETSLSILVGKTVSVTATISPSDATDKSVTWSSSDASVAKVGQTGKITAVKEGTAKITATTNDGNYSAECNVTVISDKVAVTGVSISEAAVEILVNEKHTLTATVSPSDATDKSVTWKSSDDSIATVDKDGKVTGVKAGKATITVTTNDGNRTASCSVTVSIRNVDSVSISKTELNIGLNTTFVLSATISPSDATDKNVTWKSSDDSIATVDKDGKVTGLKVGKATVTVTTNDGNKTAVCSVTVSVRSVTGVSIDRTELGLGIGEGSTLNATVSPSDATDKSVTWSSSDPSIAKVDQKGKVVGLKVGTAVVAVTTEDGNFTAECKVTVSANRVEGVSLNRTSLELDIGDNFVLTAIVTPSDATDTTVQWESSDPSVAKVDGNGKVTGVKLGTATVKVITNDGGKTATCTVKVGKAVESVTLDKTELVLDIGATWKLTAKVLPSDASVTTVSWSSSDDSVATVDEAGNVKALAVGKAVITATSDEGSKSSNCSVTVQDEMAKGKITEKSEGSTTVATKKGDTWSSESELNSAVITHGAVASVNVSENEVDDAVGQIKSVRDRVGYTESVIKVSSGDASCEAADFMISSEALGKIASVSGVSVSLQSSASSIVLSDSVVKMLADLGKDATVSAMCSGVDERDEASMGITGGQMVVIDIEGDSKTIHQLSGTATVSVPYSVPAGCDASDVAVWYIDSGTPEKVNDAVFDPSTGMVTFNTSHMSMWVIGADTGQQEPSDTADDRTVLILVLAVLIVFIAVAAAVSMRKSKI